MNELLEATIRIAKQAGDVILAYCGKQHDQLSIQQKNDKTLLTAADLAAHRCIEYHLRALTPDIPILSEEGIIPSLAIRKAWRRYWLVDPLDGTRGFVAGSTDFTTNIALIEEGKAILGVIYVPVDKMCYYASPRFGAFKKMENNEAHAITTRRFQQKNYCVVLGKFLEKSGLLSDFESEPHCRVERLNSSLKFCRIAEGKADLYPRLGQTSEWDTGAGQCIVEAAGGAVVSLSNEPVIYNTKETLKHSFFLALGDPTVAKEILQFIQDKRRKV